MAPAATRPAANTRRSWRTDLRIAWMLQSGSDRREWWRLGLTALCAGLATGLAVTAITLMAYVEPSSGLDGGISGSLLAGQGTRRGIAMTLLGLLVPVIALLGQSSRIGAVHRDRRLAVLRLTGATPRQVRRIMALEAGLAALLGSAAASVLCVAVLAGRGYLPEPAALAALAVVPVGIPVLTSLAGVFALRRVVASPLGTLRRVKPEQDWGTRLLIAAGGVLVVGALIAVVVAGNNPGTLLLPIGAFALVLLVGAGAVLASGAFAKLAGRRLATSARPAVLIAAGRLAQDPWAAARTHASVLATGVVGVGAVGIWRIVHDGVVNADYYTPGDEDFYDNGFALFGVAVLVALGFSLFALAIGTAESLVTRRRSLAAQAAAGVPYKVLARSVLLETALPLAPAVALSGIGGFAIYAYYHSLMAGYQETGISLPVLLPLLVPFAVYGACLLAVAATLPLLRRTVHPGELRYE
ncbi:ABC transporter permease [Streptomyces sp. TRM66268-LWL]|uniref:ABC transporter permease n=2 Tax=Streptomyces polyasparticus TaxID=2767826 RepID=A0ABR7SUP4_9ACTN|nr:ABC transporter permease [Streptomyces polyasparticus]